MNLRSITMTTGIILTAVSFFSLPAESMYEEDHLREERSHSLSYHPLIEEEREELTDARKLEAVTYLVAAVTTSLAMDAYQRGKRRIQSPTAYIVSTEEDAERYFETGMQCIQNKSYKDALEFFKMAAYLKHIEARYNLGQLYEYGLGTPISYTEAAKWYAASLEHEKSSKAHKRVIRKELKQRH